MTDFIAAIIPIVYGAVLIEGVVSAISAVVESVRTGAFDASYKPIVALAIGIGVAVLYSLDLFAGVGLVTGVPFVGAVLSGVILSRGAGYVYDIIASLNAYRKQAEDALSSD